ncbi:MAG: nucleotidyl transferase AbiEii/AbiGii toxin family protein [Patescibacteria group bacterium]
MSEQIISILKRKLDDLAAYGELDSETCRNALKEELQFYILNFIYHHPEHSKWVMYGGSALRIIHGLDRMSVDLDFEVSYAVTGAFLKELKKELEDHFENTYGTDSNFLTIKVTTGRGILLKFNVGEALSFGHPSNQVHVKIDLNQFVAPKTVVRENRLINKGQLSFVILVYNMSALMASKLAAIFLREARGIDKDIYSYKGRDIYDLLWYMGKKITPDFDYVNTKLEERKKEVSDLRTIFNKLTIDILNYEKMDDCLKADGLPHLFENPHQFENWLQNWRESYLRLLDDYQIHTITEFENVRVHHDLMPDTLYFIYTYKTEEGGFVRVMYLMSDYWITFNDGNLSTKENSKIKDMIEFTSSGSTSHPPSKEKLRQYATLFYLKTEMYFKKTNRVMLGDVIRTKLIRMTADNLNPKEQIVLNKSALLSSELDDLLK